jgi:hypothetical protein
MARTRNDRKAIRRAEAKERQEVFDNWAAEEAGAIGISVQMVKELHKANSHV